MSDDAVRYTFRWHVNDKNPDVRALLKVIKRERKEAADRIEADARRIAEAEARAERLEAALLWYGEQARLCRMIHSEGDAGRQALNDDGGKRALAALQQEGGE